MKLVAVFDRETKNTRRFGVIPEGHESGRPAVSGTIYVIKGQPLPEIDGIRFVNTDAPDHAKLKARLDPQQ